MTGIFVKEANSILLRRVPHLNILGYSDEAHNSHMASTRFLLFREPSLKLTCYNFVPTFFKVKLAF